MINTNTVNSIPHRSPCRITRAALSIASSEVGSNKRTPAPSFGAALMSHCLVSKTFQSKSPVRVPRGKSLPRHGQLRSTDCPNTSYILSAMNLSFDSGTTQVATKPCGLSKLPDVGIKEI